jgi:arginine utilization protein RocB
MDEVHDDERGDHGVAVMVGTMTGLAAGAFIKGISRHFGMAAGIGTMAIAAAGLGYVALAQLGEIEYQNESRGGRWTTAPVKTFVASFVTSAAFAATLS